VTYVFEPRLQRIRCLDFIGETAWTIVERVVKTERVGCVGYGCLDGCLGGNEAKRRFLIEYMSDENGKSRRGMLQTMASG
jgi:hypothetical protein